MATLWAFSAGSARSGYVDMLHSATVSTARCCKASRVAIIATDNLVWVGQANSHQVFWRKFKVDRGNRRYCVVDGPVSIHFPNMNHPDLLCRDLICSGAPLQIRMPRYGASLICLCWRTLRLYRYCQLRACRSRYSRACIELRRKGISPTALAIAKDEEKGVAPSR